MEKGDLSARIDAKIREKTGLVSKKAIQAYHFFCCAADYDGRTKGMILDGDAKRYFYDITRKEILEKQGIKNLDMLDDKRKEEINEKIHGAVSRKYAHWYNLFMEKGLISAPRKPFPKCHYIMPMLLGYNPFNDLGFYIPYKSKGQKEWNGRISRDFLTPEERKRMKELGEVFKV